MRLPSLPSVPSVLNQQRMSANQALQHRECLRPAHISWPRLAGRRPAAARPRWRSTATARLPAWHPVLPCMHEGPGKSWKSDAHLCRCNGLISRLPRARMHATRGCLLASKHKEYIVDSTPVLACWAQQGCSWSQSSSFLAASPSPDRGWWHSTRCSERLHMRVRGTWEGGGALVPAELLVP